MDSEDRPFSSPPSRLNHASIQAAISSLPMDAPPPVAPFPKLSKVDSDLLILQTRIQAQDRKLAQQAEKQDRQAEKQDKRLSQLSEKFEAFQNTQTRTNDQTQSQLEVTNDKIDSHAASQIQLLQGLSQQLQILGAKIDEKATAQNSFASPTKRYTQEFKNKPFSLAPTAESDVSEEDIPSPGKASTKVNTGRFYAVWRGRSGNAIYTDWTSCQRAVEGFSGVKYKRFSSEDSAEEFIFSNDQERLTKKKSPLNAAAFSAKPPLKVEPRDKKGTSATSKFSATRTQALRDSEDSGEDSLASSFLANTSLGSSRSTKPSPTNSAFQDSQELHCIRDARFYDYYQPRTDNGILTLPTMDTAVSLSESNMGFTILCPDGSLYYVVPLMLAPTKERKVAQIRPIQVRISNPSLTEIVGGYTKPTEAAYDPSHLFPGSWLAYEHYFTLMNRYIQDHFYSIFFQEEDMEAREEAAKKRVEVTRQFDTFRVYVRSLIDSYVLTPEFEATQVVSWAHILLFIHNIMNRFFANGMIAEHLNPSEFQDQWSLHYKHKVQHPTNKSDTNLRVCLGFLQCYCPYCGVPGSTKEYCSAIVCAGATSREATNKAKNDIASAPLKAWQEAYNKAKTTPAYTTYEAYCKLHPRPMVKVDSTAADYTSMQHRLTLRPVVSSFRADIY